MHPAERRIGEFILEFPGDLATYSASELAQLAGVSSATVSRFIKTLGYGSYNEARREVREESRAGSRLLLQRTEGQGADWLSTSTSQSVSNVENTMSEKGSDRIDAIAGNMLEARKVRVVGFRTNHPLARYLQWQSLQVVPGIEVMPGAGETMGENIVDVDSKDLVIVFGLRRRGPLVFRTLDAVERIGASVLYITDERARLRLRRHGICAVRRRPSIRFSITSRSWRCATRSFRARSNDPARRDATAFARSPGSIPRNGKSARTTNAIERLNKEFRRRIKTQTVLPDAETAPMLFWALLASGQIVMRKVDGWETLDQPLEAKTVDLAA